MTEIKVWDSDCGGAIVCHNLYLKIYYYSNFTNNVAGRYSGMIMLNTCSLNIQGNASLVGNKAYDGGAMMLQNTNSTIHLFLNKNLAYWGGALSIIEGKFIIKGYTLFDSNYANSSGGALYISSHVNFIFCGFQSVYSGSNSTSFDPGALPLSNTKAFDAECFTDNALSFNNILA